MLRALLGNSSADYEAAAINSAPEVSVSAAGLQMEKLNGSKVFPKPYTKSARERQVTASQLDPTPWVVLVYPVLTLEQISSAGLWEAV